jgi:hypothetical protein
MTGFTACSGYRDICQVAVFKDFEKIGTASAMSIA